MRGFWADILPAALDLDFPGIDAPERRNLRDLQSLHSEPETDRTATSR
jgi:hypothetical protein